MQRHRLFAAGVAAAMILGIGGPAMAAPGKGKGHAYGHAKKAAKPAKPEKPAKGPKAPKSKAHLTGGGTTANGVEFSVQGKGGKLDKAHFNYTSADGAIKVRCRGFDSMDAVVYVQPGPPAMHVTAECHTKGEGRTRTPIWLDATFTDNGETGDTASISLDRRDGVTPVITDSGAVTGEINVRY